MPVLMDADRVERTLTRIAHEISERNRGEDQLAIVGIRTRGAVIARRLADKLVKSLDTSVPTGTLDITL